jgi:uncharacterized protein YjbI with pentapeptide repeats
MSDRCGYTWAGDDPAPSPLNNSCCYRETWNDKDYCAIHAPRYSQDSGKPGIQAVRREIKRQTDQRGVFDGADFSGLEFGEALDLSNCLVREADLSGGTFASWTFSGAYLQHADLSDADLRGVDFSDACLAGVNLTGADLGDANLSGANLRNTNLTDVTLRNADFSEAALSWADLRSTDLRNAQLTRTSFANANLVNVDFGGSIQRGTIFRGTEYAEPDENTSSSRFLERLGNGLNVIHAQLDKAKTRARQEFARRSLTARKSGSELSNVALLICGLPRTFQQTYPNLRDNILEYNENVSFDVFFNTTFIPPSSPQSFDEEYFEDFCDEDHFRSVVRSVYGDNLVDIELIQSKSDEFPQRLFNENKKQFYTYRCLRAFHTCRTHERKQGTSYDRYVCLRPDIEFTNIVDLTNFDGNDRLYFIPGDFIRETPFHNRDWDYCCIGDRDAIAEWCKYWAYRPDIVPYFDQPSVDEKPSLPDGFAGSWNWSHGREEGFPFAYRLAASCQDEGISLDVATAESTGLYGRIVR